MFFVSLRYEWKIRRAHFRMAGVARHTMCTSDFSFIPQGNEKNQQSILKYFLDNYDPIFVDSFT